MSEPNPHRLPVDALLRDARGRERLCAENTAGKAESRGWGPRSIGGDRRGPRTLVTPGGLALFPRAGTARHGTRPLECFIVRLLAAPPSWAMADKQRVHVLGMQCPCTR